MESSRNIKSKVPRGTATPVPLITIERREEIGVVYEDFETDASPLAVAFAIAADYVANRTEPEPCNLEWEYGSSKFSITVEPRD